MHIDHDLAAWAPAPLRPRWKLALLFAATVTFLPPYCLLWLAVMGAVMFLGSVVEAIAMVIPPVEDAAEKLINATLNGLLWLGSWFVLWPELRHEGDAAYYRARVDRRLARWTSQASAASREPKRAHLALRTLPLHDYRGVGAGYVAEAARAQGWELRPSDVRREMRLRWAAAPA